MGNRAVITTKNSNLGIYLHWHGGMDSVEAFCEYCRLKHYRSPAEDDAYAFARLAQVVGNYTGGGESVGVVNPTEWDAGSLDNGIYYIGEDWRIVSRNYPWPDFTELSDDGYHRLLHDIDSRQPVLEQLGTFLDAKEVDTGSLKVGDNIWMWDHLRKVDRYTFVPGYTRQTVVRIEDGAPWVDRYSNPDNPNNRLRKGVYRLA